MGRPRNSGQKVSSSNFQQNCYIFGTTFSFINPIRDHLFSPFAKFSEKLMFRHPWYAPENFVVRAKWMAPKPIEGSGMKVPVFNAWKSILGCLSRLQLGLKCFYLLVRSVKSGKYELSKGNYLLCSWGNSWIVQLFWSASLCFFLIFFFKRSVFFACEILISESSECIYRWYLDSQIVGRDTHSSKQRVEEFTF